MGSLRDEIEARRRLRWGGQRSVSGQAAQRDMLWAARKALDRLRERVTYNERSLWLIEWERTRQELGDAE